MVRSSQVFQRPYWQVDTSTLPAEAPAREFGVYTGLRVCADETDFIGHSQVRVDQISITVDAGEDEFDITLTSVDGQYYGGAYSSDADEVTISTWVLRP